MLEMYLLKTSVLDQLHKSVLVTKVLIKAREANIPELTQNVIEEFYNRIELKDRFIHDPNLS